jgi:hypothetical protein
MPGVLWFGKAHGGRALPVLQWIWDGPDRRAQVEATLPTQVLQGFLFTATNSTEGEQMLAFLRTYAGESFGTLLM